VLAAANVNGLVLEYARPEFMQDKEIMLAAVQQNPRAALGSYSRMEEDAYGTTWKNTYEALLPGLDPDVLAAVRSHPGWAEIAASLDDPLCFHNHYPKFGNHYPKFGDDSDDEYRKKKDKNIDRRNGRFTRY